MFNHRVRKIFCLAAVAWAVLFICPAYSGTNMLAELSEADEPSGGYYMTDEPIFQIPEEKTSADPRMPRSYPTDPSSDIVWSSGMSGVSDIQTAFNTARQAENSQLGTSIPMLTLPSQSQWDAMSDGEKALWLINRERIDRGVAPLHSLEENVTSVAQYYAQYLINNNTWGHSADGRSPWERLEDNPAIGACHDFLNIAENLAVFMTTGTSIPLPLERSIFGWMYKDGSCCSCGHRHAILWYPYTDNSGTSGMEGFLGIGRANGSYIYNGVNWNFAEMIVMNVFDPCSTWDYGTPTVTTSSISSITQTTASSGGSISSDGGASVTARGVCWSTAQNPTTSNSKTSNGTGTGTFTSSLTGLTANTTYYVRAYATNSAGTAYGNQISFTTPQALSVPTVTTSAATSVTQTAASSGGNVTSAGGSTVTARGVCWNTAQNPTTSNSKTSNGTGTGTFTSSLTGLTANTTYYVRAYAINSAGTAYGNQISFTTPQALSVPTVTTSAATSVTQTAASSGGNVTSAGGSTVTARGVCWNTAQNPTTSNSKTSNGTGTGTFTSSLTGLTANTTYYVRAYATNSAGTAYGNQVSFTTLGENDDLIWLTSKAAAVSAALSQGKRILLLAGRDTCGYTTYMRDTVCEMTNPPIKNVIMEFYVPWFCHMDNSTEWYQYASGLDSFYLPLICRIDPSNPDSYIDQSTNTQNPDDFYARLLDGINTKGDINTIAGLDLGDAILALQICSGRSGLTVNMAGEVNGDGRIGQEEAVYVLRKLSQ